jgi:hypothetical protein
MSGDELPGDLHSLDEEFRSVVYPGTVAVLNQCLAVLF